jgi:hypothetical protein
MPTGYTAKIEDGISFEEFVLTCARQFSALVTMKDDPLDTKIPDKFEPSNHIVEKIKETQEELEMLQYITEGEADMQAQREYEEQMKSLIERLYEKRKLRRKYENMLNKVYSWEPPTEDHQPLKNFMIQQLEDSIRHDCNEKIVYELMPNRPMTGREYINFWKDQLQKDLEYYQNQYQNEKRRAEERTQWVKQLKNSLESIKE